MILADRHILQGVQELLVAERDKIGYAMKRPMGTASIDSVDALRAAIATGFSMDCSEAISLACHVAGWKNPSGLSWSYGDTQTMLDHLGHLGGAEDANIGCIVIFNADKSLQEQHGAQVHTADPSGGNPLLFSHGTADGPGFITLAMLQTGFSGQTVFLNVSGLVSH